MCQDEAGVQVNCKRDVSWYVPGYPQSMCPSARVEEVFLTAPLPPLCYAFSTMVLK